MDITSTKFGFMLPSSCLAFEQEFLKLTNEIDEVIDEIDKGDMDNDGKDEPDDEEYLQNKDKAIKAAMKSTKEGLDTRPVKRLKDIGGVTTGIPMLGDMIKSK